MLVLADRHQAFKLKRMALMLVANNMNTIVNTDVYKEFHALHPNLSLEITKALAEKLGGAPSIPAPPRIPRRI